ncbi:TPA: hypothetical protein ACHSNJ_001028 [Klebsiella pneumoniae]|nr:hypothetical protein [Klebsiella pneumoniae]
MTKSTITREQLEEWVAQFDEDGGCDATDRQLEALIHQSLAAMDSEPVALQPELAKVIYHFRDWNEGFPVERFKADYVISWMLANYPPAQPAPVVPEKCPAEIRDLISSHTDALFNDDDAQEIWNACRAAMLQAEPVCTCPSGDGSLRWPCPVHPGNSPVIPEGYVLVPMRLTAENGAKGALSGEFSETKFVNCPECFGDDECETCDGSGKIEITVPVTWTTIKAIWVKGVEHFAVTAQEND